MFRSRTSYGTFVVGGTRINTLKITYKFVKVVNYNQWRVEELNGRRAKQAIIYKKTPDFFLPRSLTLGDVRFHATIFNLNPGKLSNELSRRPEYTTITGRDRTVFPESTVNVAAFSFPLLQVKSTVMPPRMRAPRIDPFDHCMGRAGRRVTTSGVSKLATSGACMSAF